MSKFGTEYGNKTMEIFKSKNIKNESKCVKKRSKNYFLMIIIAIRFKFHLKYRNIEEDYNFK